MSAEQIPDIIFPLKDQDKCRVTKLSNGITTVFISNARDEDQNAKSVRNVPTDEPTVVPEFPKASCIVELNVGHFHNPKNFPGLNDCIVDILQKGVVRFPQDNGLSNFLESFDATLDIAIYCEKTIISVTDIPNEKLGYVVLYLSRFFTDPIKVGDVMPEVKKDVERDMAATVSSQAIKTQFLTQLARPDHPLYNLTPQRVENFSNIPENVLCEQMLKFKKTYYNANRMIVRLESTYPLKQMELIARKYLLKIRNNGTPVDEWPECADLDPFKGQNSEKFHKMYKFPTMQDEYMVCLVWSVPSITRSYRAQAANYIASLLKKTGEGSLIRYLKKNNFCTDVCISSTLPEYFHVSNNSLYLLFEVQFYLTAQMHMNDAFDAFFSYVNFLKNEGSHAWYFDDLQNIEDMKYDIAVRVPSFKRDASWSSFRRNSLWKSDDREFEHDPEAIINFFGYLDPKRVSIWIFENLSGGGITSYDDWCTEYGLGSEIPDTWIKKWREIEPRSEFKHPGRNTFVVDDFDISTRSENRHPIYPKKIRSDGRIEVWWKPSSDQELYETYFFFQLASPLPSSSIKNMAMLDILQILLNDILEEKYALAIEAGYEYLVTSNDKGIWIRINGFNQHMMTLLKIVADTWEFLPMRLTEAEFHALKKKYCTQNVSDAELATDISLSLTRQFHCLITDKRRALWEVDMKQFCSFLNEYTDNMREIYMIQGNVLEKDVIDLVKKASNVVCTSYPRTFVGKRLIELTLNPGVQCCSVKSMSNDYVGSCIGNTYQFSNNQISDLPSLLECLAIILKSLIVDFMEKDQYFTFEYFHERKSYSIRGRDARRPSANTLADIDEKIEKIRQRQHEIFVEMSDDEIIMMKNTLIEKLMEMDYKTETHENWIEVMSGGYIFGRCEHQAEAIKTMSCETFRKSMLKLTAPLRDNDQIAKLNVQVDVFDDHPRVHSPFRACASLRRVSASVFTSNDFPRPRKLQLLAPPDENAGIKYVTDIEAFKQELQRSTDECSSSSFK